MLRLSIASAVFAYNRGAVESRREKFQVTVTFSDTGHIRRTRSVRFRVCRGLQDDWRACACNLVWKGTRLLFLHLFVNDSLSGVHCCCTMKMATCFPTRGRSVLESTCAASGQIRRARDQRRGTNCRGKHRNPLGFPHPSPLRVRAHSWSGLP